MEDLLATALAQLATVSVADWIAIITGAAYAVLAVRRSRWCWLMGAISSGVLVYIAQRAKLPMQSALQLFYVAMAAYGFWRWSRASESQAIAISRWPATAHMGAIVAMLALAWFAGPALAASTAAAWPRLDTLVMLGSLLATWMTAQGKLENWIYWIVIDFASVYLFYVQAAVGAALLYLIYTAIAIAGALAWARQYRAQRVAAAT
jgi:nicotinamide mononucleotide transporter